MPRETRVHEVSYKKHTMQIKDDCLPKLPHVDDNHEEVVPDEAYINKVGIVRRADGTELEYQDLRVYFKRET